jgi:hypothetical protein
MSGSFAMLKRCSLKELVELRVEVFLASEENDHSGHIVWNDPPVLARAAFIEHHVVDLVGIFARNPFAVGILACEQLGLRIPQ